MAYNRTALFAIAVACLSTRADAQSLELEQAVQIITVDAFAIGSGDLPNDAMLRDSYEISRNVAVLPALVYSPDLQSLQSQLKVDAAQLQSFAESQDSGSAAGAASDLLTDLGKFRARLGMPL